MSALQGFDEYMVEHAGGCVFETLGVGGRAVWHLHGQRVVTARLASYTAYEVTLEPGEGEPLALHKTDIQFFHTVEDDAAVAARLKRDANVRARKLEPILKAKDRYIVKNKTLYVLMRERSVILCTLLDGDVLRGLVASYSRYAITLLLKGGVPVTVLRHAILDFTTKEGQSQLKSVQDRRKDWKKSELYLARA